MTQSIVFVSYSHKDEKEKDELLSHLSILQHAGFIGLWSDDQIGAGANWETEINQAIKQAKVAILLVSANFLASDFIAGKEVSSLLNRRKHEGLVIFPVIAKACAWQTVDWLTKMRVRPKRGKPVWSDAGSHVDEELAAIAEEIAHIINALGSVHRSISQRDSKPRCPYPGMVPFSAEDARFFYGRQTEINRMTRLLRDRRRLFVIGPSGSGKSSLVFAGVLPKLPETNFFRKKPWLVRTMRPGSQPWSTLERAIRGDPIRPNQTAANLLANDPAARQLLLVIDQFEELFTQVEQAEQNRFITALQALRSVENCALVIIIRADFYHDLMKSNLWPVKQGERLEVAPLRGKMLRLAIEQPATEVKVKLEAGLVERLLADAADEPGALPLVQETMVQLWEEMRDCLLPLSAYERLTSGGRSGLAGAMADRAEAILDELEPIQRPIARRIFLRLIQFGEGRADTRRQLPIDGLKVAFDDPDLFDQTLSHLTDNRLLTLSGEEGHARQVDIAHEALIRGNAVR